MIGRICVKLNGREAGRTCVIVNQLDDNFVIIDGNVKRRKCNIDHLEFTEKKINIKKDASKEEVIDSMKKSGIEVLMKRAKNKKSSKGIIKETKPTKNAKTKK